MQKSYKSLSLKRENFAPPRGKTRRKSFLPHEPGLMCPLGGKAKRILTPKVVHGINGEHQLHFLVITRE